VLLIAAAFAGFLLSRYATGMSTNTKHKPLRTGGSSLLGASIFALVLAACLALAQFNFPIPIKVMAYIIPALLVVLGVETAANGILDIYRPRIKDQYQRASFDSRLLGVINEPGEILHTLAGAIDYQFGFKVSQTWFYQLLSEAIVPLVLLAAVVLYCLSCLVVVNPNEQAIVERFGNPLNQTGEVRLLEPGLSFKWPWPIDIAHKFPTEAVKELYVGYKPTINPETGLPKPEKQLLWGKKHYEEEESLLVASPQTGQSAGAVPVSLVNANIPIHYRIDNLYDYLYNHEQPDKLLRAMCYRELARFAASSTVEVDNPQQLEKSILGAGRQKAQQALTERIQAKANEKGLGIKILFVGLQGVHPPVDVAPEYQKVIGSIQKKQAAILNAHTYRNVLLSRLAGSVSAATELYNLALEYDQADAASTQADKLAEDLDRGFEKASGEIFATLRAARAYRYKKANLAEASGKRFADQLKAYRAAPNIYKRQLRLDAFSNTLKKTRKYVVVADQNDVQIYIVDLKEKLTPSLYDITGLEESK
jgi:regulator of protease activity HflC (stomatin/prohibitin superfamily)